MTYSYRLPGSREWQSFGDYNVMERTGFYPFAVDRDRNLVYGLKKEGGRFALCAIVLDKSLKEEVVFSRPDVDVDELIRIGRRGRVVGVSYATDVRHVVYFDSGLDNLTKSLSKALPGQPAVQIVDSNVDESKLLIFSASDADPGVYYILDRKSHELRTFLVARSQLEGVKLAAMKPMSYAASDGTTNSRLPHLAPRQGQFERAAGHRAAAWRPPAPATNGDSIGCRSSMPRVGFAVLQPNFRGSAGYGDAWFEQNGFRPGKQQLAMCSMPVVGWSVKASIRRQLGIVGWSYGGYAALQSSVVDPTLFKAVVAIAPVTDLRMLKEEYRNWSNFNLMNDYHR